MLFTVLKQVVRDIWARRITNKSPVNFICATRLSRHEFWEKAPTGRSLQALKSQDRKVTFQIAYENREGLPAVYNRALENTKSSEVVIFIHDDVWLKTDEFYKSIDRALNQFDVIGVAGNRRVVKFQPAWAFDKIVDGKFIWDHDNIAGDVIHGNPESNFSQYYGPTPAACELLDGVMLAVRSRRLMKAGVKFDERFNFHLYDMDFCRSARRAGLRLGAWKVALIHESKGEFGGPNWLENYNKYIQKWDAPQSN